MGHPSSNPRNPRPTPGQLRVCKYNFFNSGFASTNPETLKPDNGVWGAQVQTRDRRSLCHGKTQDSPSQFEDGHPRIAERMEPQTRKRPCYKLCMKNSTGWLLFKYVGLEMTPLSKPFKTKEQAEKERLKYPERERKGIGVGVVRMGE